MSWRDLTPIDSDWRELEHPDVSESVSSRHSNGGNVTLTFEDTTSREWFAEWCRSKRGWTAFMTWVDEKR